METTTRIPVESFNGTVCIQAGEVFESAATNLAADMKTQRSMRSAANSMSPSIEAVSGVPSLKDVTKRKKVPHHIVNG